MVKVPSCQRCDKPRFDLKLPEDTPIFQCECGQWAMIEWYAPGECADCKEGKLCLAHELLRLQRFEANTRHLFGKLGAILRDAYHDN